MAIQRFYAVSNNHCVIRVFLPHCEQDHGTLPCPLCPLCSACLRWHTSDGTPRRVSLRALQIFEKDLAHSSPLRFSVTNPATGLHISTSVRTPSLDKDAKPLKFPHAGTADQRVPPAVSMPPTPRTSIAHLSMRMSPSSPACGRVPPPSTDQKCSHVSRAHWRSASRPWRSSRRCRPVVLYGRCAPSSAVFPNGCESLNVLARSRLHSPSRSEIFEGTTMLPC